MGLDAIITLLRTRAELGRRDLRFPNTLLDGPLVGNYRRPVTAYQEWLKSTLQPTAKYLTSRRKGKGGITGGEALRIILAAAEGHKANGEIERAKELRQRVALARARPGSKAYERDRQGRFTS